MWSYAEVASAPIIHSEREREREREERETMFTILLRFL
jgi:hypothetical protein